MKHHIVQTSIRFWSEDQMGLSSELHRLAWLAMRWFSRHREVAALFPKIDRPLVGADGGTE